LFAPLLGVAAVHPEHVLATPERVSRWRRRGYSVACWTVDDPERAARLHQSGVTGVITNRPGPMRSRWPA
jgi:glycerophosphoryl diester phosphodiesterase